MKKTLTETVTALQQYDYRPIFAKIEPVMHGFLRKLCNLFKPVLIQFFNPDEILHVDTPFFNVHGTFDKNFFDAVSRLQSMPIFEVAIFNRLYVIFDSICFIQFAEGTILGTLAVEAEAIETEEDVGSVIAIDWGTENSRLNEIISFFVIFTAFSLKIDFDWKKIR